MNNTKRYIIDEIAGIKTIRKHKYRSSADDKKGQVRECFSLLFPQRRRRQLGAKLAFSMKNGDLLSTISFRYLIEAS